MTQWIGYRWLAEKFQVETVNPLRIQSQIGPSRRTHQYDATTTEVYTTGSLPDETLPAHLTFALKHEGVHLEFLAHLFQRAAESEIAQWVNKERTGQYARRAGFLWEWLNGRELHGVEAVPSGNYVDAIDPAWQFASADPVNNQRWRVRDNLPGDRNFCPSVYLTPGLQPFLEYDPAFHIENLQAEYGPDLLLRSAMWLSVKESRASFQIEHEEDLADRVKRFAYVMERRCGELENPLTPETLASLQQEILGQRNTIKTFGVRRSPVFVGDGMASRGTVHYIAPHWDDLTLMLKGLNAFIAKTQGMSPIARAAVTSFGFVYIHPLADGNGRIHRFLINDCLRRDGAVPRPFILPVSATIINKPQNRVKYDEALEEISRPFMNSYHGLYEFTRDYVRYDDGVESNFVFTGYDAAAPAWRYPDLTAHAEYVGQLVDQTIRLEMRHEAQELRAWDNARNRIKEVVEGPDTDIERIIRSIRNNRGHISNKLRAEFPVLANENVAGELSRIIETEFGEPAEPGKSSAIPPI